MISMRWRPRLRCMSVDLCGCEVFAPAIPNPLNEWDQRGLAPLPDQGSARAVLTSAKATEYVGRRYQPVVVRGCVGGA
jgi:hypothetical protein